MALKITYEDREYLLDLEDLDTDQARAFERIGVKNLKAFEDGIGEGDVSALTCAYWLMLIQNGEPGARIERVKFRPIKFLKAIGTSENTNASEQEDEEAPKEAGTSTRRASRKPASRT
jgi:hypothetical protein